MNGLVVVNYNDYCNTRKFIKKIINYKIIDYIVIVDNCSSDDSFSKLIKICNKKVFLIRNSSNKGYGSGINLGVRFLKNKFGIKRVIVSNTDIVIGSENDIYKLMNYFKKIDVALVGPTIKENGGLNRGWKIPTVFSDIILNIPYFHRFLRKLFLFYREKYYSDSYSIVDVVSGCFFIIDVGCLEEIDYFDENVFLYYEENIIATKLKEKKYKTVVVNDVFVVHNHSVKIDNNISKIKKFKELKKIKKYFYKNYYRETIFGIMSLDITNIIALLFIKIVIFLKGGKI